MLGQNRASALPVMYLAAGCEKKVEKVSERFCRFHLLAEA